VFFLKLFHVNLDVQPMKRISQLFFMWCKSYFENPEKMEPFFNCLITCLLLLLLLEKAKGYILNPVKRQSFLSHIYHMYFVSKAGLSCNQKDTQVECSFLLLVKFSQIPLPLNFFGYL
jgi:hypothetical protein